MSKKRARRLWLGDWQGADQPADSERTQPGPAQPPPAQPPPAQPDPAAADPEAGDTVVFIPVDDEAAGDPGDHRRNLRLGAIAAGIAALVALVFALTSGGGDELTSERSTTPPARAQPQVPQGQLPQAPQGAPPQSFGGADLTGSAAEKAAQAALSRYPGDIERVTRDSSGGGYVVHVIQADGNEVHVLVDGQFHVQGSDAGSAPRSFGPSTSQ